MKHKIERTNTSTKRFSTRTVAMILSVIMLIGSIATGSMLSTFAAYLNDAAKADAVTQAAAEGGNIALNAIPSEDSDTAVDNADAKPDLSGLEETAVIKRFKDDLADTGAIVDLAGSGWNFSGGKVVFYFDTEGWNGVKLHIWGSNWTHDYSMNRLDGTKIFKTQIQSNGHSGISGYQFQKSSDAGTNDGYAKDITQDTAFWPWGNDYGGDLSGSSNGTAVLKSMIKTTAGGNYTEQANSNCVATISTTTISGTDAVTTGQYAIQKTGSNSSVSVYPAYGASVNYSAVASGEYVFKGFSTTNSTSLPNNATTSFAALTSNAHRKYTAGNVDTVYAYFEKKASHTATVSDQGTSTQRTTAATVSATTSGTGSSSVSQYEDSTVYILTNQKSGYKPVISIKDASNNTINYTKDSAKKYHFTMPAKNVTVTVTYQEVGYVPVKVYAGSGGKVEVTYNSKLIATVASGENTTVQAYEGDTITLKATATTTGYSFSKWKKNMNDSYSTTATLNDTVAPNTVYVASFNSSTTSGWLYSKTLGTSEPWSSWSSYTNNDANQMRFMYGSSETGLDNAKTIGKYKANTGTNENGYWSDITTELKANQDKFYFGLCSYWNKQNLVGNKDEQVNDDGSDKTVYASDGTTILFQYQIRENGNTSSSAEFVYIHNVNWTLIENFSVLAYDKSQTATSGGEAKHNGRVNYQLYIKMKTGSDVDTSYSPSVTYYAKDGVVRHSSGTKNTARFGTTTVTAQTDVVTSGTRKNFSDDTTETWLEGKATKGMPITVETVVSSTDYYVKGFSFNGVTPEIFEPAANNTYTCTYTIPEDLDGSKLEITPIYFLKDDSNCINFYIDGYNDTVKANWGNELYVYPFYQYHVDGTATGAVTPNAGQAVNFGAYPGQPVINEGGRRYIQIPLTDDGTAGGYRVKGVTINNGYWDHVHGNTNGTDAGQESDTMGADFVSVHRQTYDYDDFYKIYNEYGKGSSKTLNNIYFTFKYRTNSDQHRTSYIDDKDKKVDQRNDDVATFTAANHKTELLKDNFGNPVDLFGTKLSDAALTTYQNKEMYVVSQGYEANNAGKFATEWAVFSRDGSSYTKVTKTSTTDEDSIVPSALVISEASRVSDTAYPALDGDIPTSGFKPMYQALEAYRGIPVYICYEKELHGGSKDGGYDPAYRSDGRWTFTKTTDYIKANVKIEYINEAKGVDKYTVDEFVDGSDVGTNTGAKAYFTYVAGESGYGATEDGKTSLSGLAINDKKYFNFKAETAGSYKFVGWYSVDTNGDYHPVNNDVLDKVTGRSAMSSDSTFVARFKYVASGSLTISHTLAAGNTGRGETYLGVYVGDDMIADENTNTDSVMLSNQYINSAYNETIKVVLRTVPNGENTFADFTAKKTTTSDDTSDVSDGQTFFNGSNTGSGTVTREITFSITNDVFSSATQAINALSYYSALNSATNDYLITYKFDDRNGDEKEYSVKGTFTEGELKAYFTGTGIDKQMTDQATQFFTDHAPHESNFMKTLTWRLSSTSDIVTSRWSSVATGHYKFTATVASTQIARKKITGVFDLPYEVISLDGTKDFNPKENVSGKVDMLDEDAHTTFELTTEYGKWFQNIPEGGSYSDYDRSSQMITAASEIDDNGTPMYFSYWQIYSLTKTSGAGKEIARAYHPRFNYVGYEDYYIKAVYSDTKQQLVDEDSEMTTSISFIEDSRNQWNNKDKTASDSTDDARDIIYNDFALSFHYGDKLLSDCVGSGYNNIRLGMVIQKLDQVDMNGDEHIGTLESYETKYQNSVQGTHDKLVTALASSAWTNGKWANIKYDGTNKYASFNHVIAANNETIAGVSGFTTDLIDNKNRTEYHFSLDNSQGQTDDLTAKNVYTNKMYVYRAFSYIMEYKDGSWDIKVSEKPAYFCMYDRATRTK